MMTDSMKKKAVDILDSIRKRGSTRKVFSKKFIVVAGISVIVAAGAALFIKSLIKGGKNDQ